MSIEKITIEFLRECFFLDEETGVLTWRERPEHHFACSARVWNSRYAGKVAGREDVRSRRKVRIYGVEYFSHRVIYALHNGIDLVSVPEQIDHRDCDVTNNRPSNLRAATASENQCNKRGTVLSRGLPKGVCFEKGRGKWRSDIQKSGVTRSLGRFDSPEEAAAAYREAAIKLHGEFARF